jgi:hypothetical protein
MSFKRRFDPSMFSGAKQGFVAAIARAFESLVVLAYLLPILWFCIYGPGSNFARGFLLRSFRTSTEALEISKLWIAIAVPLMIVIILIHLAARWLGDNKPPSIEE